MYWFGHGKTKFNPLLHRYSFRRFNNGQLLKTLWVKKKLLVMSNFSFSHNVFKVNQITVSPFVHIFDIISLFGVESEKPKIGRSGKGLSNTTIYAYFRLGLEMMVTSIFSFSHGGFDHSHYKFQFQSPLQMLSIRTSL